MKSESSAGMLWVGEDDDGTRYRVQVVGGVAERALLIQKSAPGAGWLVVEAGALPRAGLNFLRALGDLCSVAIARAVAEPINPVYEVDDEITSPGFDLRGIGQIFFPPIEGAK